MKTQKDTTKPQISPSMVEDKAIEKLKKRAQDLGLIVNAGAEAKTPKSSPTKKESKK